MRGGACGVPVTASYTQKLPRFGTLRERVGYASEGLASLSDPAATPRLDADARATAGGVSAALSTHQNRNGWTLGTGVELALGLGGPRWKLISAATVSTGRFPPAYRRWSTMRISR